MFGQLVFMRQRDQPPVTAQNTRHRSCAVHEIPAQICFGPKTTPCCRIWMLHSIKLGDAFRRKFHLKALAQGANRFKGPSWLIRDDRQIG